MNKDFSGVYAAVATPFKPDFSIDQESFLIHCRWLLTNGCDGLAVFGTTGEANSLTVKERISALEGLHNEGIHSEHLMPGVGCCAHGDTIELVRASMELGVHKVLALPPFFYKAVGDDGLFAAYAEVIEQVSDERLRLYLYHFPQMSGVAISPGLIERLLKAYPDTVAGMKDSSGDLKSMVDNAKRFPGFSVIAGADEHLLSLLKEGGAGCITAVVNIATALAAEVYKAYQSGNEGAAEAAQQKLSAVRSVFSDFPLFGATKEALAAHYENDQWRRLRPPLMSLEKPQADALIRKLEAIGFTAPPPPA